MRPDIRDWKKIDSVWLESVLAQNGFDVRISDFTAKPVGTGQIGDCARFSIEYASAPANAPRTLVGKFPSEGEESRNTARMLSNYFREVKFYQHLQKRARIATPDCYHADLNDETHDFVLIMEDLAPAEQGDQLAGVTLPQAELVLKEAGKLHASYWNNDELEQYPWIQETTNAPDVIPPELFASLWDGLIDRYGDRVTEKARHVGKSFSRNIEAYGEMRNGNKCLIHTDYRPDNMLFATPAGGKPVTIVDWQSFAYGPPASDVGYFIAGAITQAERRANENRLLALYAETLNTYGAGEYSEDELKLHYIIGAYQLVLTAYFAAMMVTQTARGDDMFFRMLNGGIDLIYDHGAENWFTS